jgi:hypothetical protein
LGKISQSQTPILIKFAGQLNPNPIVDLKIMRSSSDGNNFEELDYGNAPSSDYTVEDLVKMVTLKNPSFEGGNEVAYQFFISQVAEEKVREL